MHRRIRHLFGLLALGAMLAACQTIGDAPVVAEPAPQLVAEPTAPTDIPTSADAATAVLPLPGSASQVEPALRVPHIYMALQPDGEGKPVSVVFAIDASRDNTPRDDTAVRLTPENGLCNPQEMRGFNFPDRYIARPMTSEFEQSEGLTVSELPGYMALSVSNEMVAIGLASTLEDTRALNICTRKLWERLIAGDS
ncbi:MAG TPA: hypothetical protein VMY41_07095 [Thermohalobaculum sp.]|nr:hypothetical protein [Thermohalobaculum sp.]